MTAGQYFNNVWWQNDPDVVFLRDRFLNLSETEISTLALFAGIMGGGINTSDALHEIPAERLRLWRFIAPGPDPQTARLPLWGEAQKTIVAMRDYSERDASAALFVNPTGEEVTRIFTVQELIGVPGANVWTWGPSESHPRGQQEFLTLRLPLHGSELVYLSRTETAPPEMLRG